MRKLTPLMPAFAILAAPMLVAVPLTPAVAQQRHNSNAPIDFGADQIQLQDKANRAVLSGNVVVKQAEMTLTATRMTVTYTGQVIGGNPQVSRLDASGGVTVRRPDQVARSQYAIYDLNRRVITMIGAVSLTQGGGNTVNGGRLTINLDTGRAVIDGSSVAGGSGGGQGTGDAGGISPRGGRVTGTFSVPKRN
ncbi:lipopolysaccharide export system protein LptA [Sphingomonas sp. SORGH_AS802]|jgi:lipopolysaccharide export system protein LptA|uniref:LptA/OstA family protein n=1 Tax=unclassified Sphingomonas TaxID=196159 RepID=UPI002857524F|nr:MULTISPECIES: LptA/OstA family protein [unclassified Sphingomonas]MDR6128168.1 lipopolysaccharide export system protein LptA [Sphingomonas sp. SORGH_AS_0438]MDR6135628.1 lipopolysaccharide export system protein LptA [Sphingomonas sp. SORGH_AS_0802]